MPWRQNPLRDWQNLIVPVDVSAEMSIVVGFAVFGKLEVLVGDAACKY